MSRQAIALIVVGFVLVAVAYFFLLFKPQSDKIAEIEDQIATVQTQQNQASATIAARQDLRNRAPEIEAAIGTTEAVIPSSPSVPAALRQLQLAADEAGVELLTISPGRPSATGLADMSIAVTLNGGYFQIVDFLRRVEDPSITPRAITWQSLALAPSAYPVLSASLSGSFYANLPAPAAPAAEDGGGDGGDTTEEGGE